MKLGSIKKTSVKLFLFLLFIFQGATQITAQSSHSLLLEPEFNVVLQNEKPWSYSFGVAHRGILLEVYEEEKVRNYYTRHLDLNHYTRYSFNSQFQVALRVRYRLREIFDDIRHDEIRFMEEAEYEHSNWRFQPAHRLRIEQRIEDIVSHRFRYKLGISQPVSEEFTATLATEALYSIAKNNKPEPEQRFAIGVENTSFKSLKLSLGLEYQLGDYLREPQRESYILTGATLYL